MTPRSLAGRRDCNRWVVTAFMSQGLTSGERIHLIRAVGKQRLQLLLPTSTREPLVIRGVVNNVQEDDIPKVGRVEPSVK